MRSDTYIRHLKAIGADAVTKTNVAGLRKILNNRARLDNGWSVAPHTPNVSEAEAIELETQVETKQPRVVGELHDSGVKVLRNPRYAKRWTPEQADIIANLDHFRLIGFDWIGPAHVVPIYRVFSKDGRRFAFRNIPWQSGGNGPETII